MATLNLANKQKSDIQYDIIEFSDSQRLLKLTSHVLPNWEVAIVSRFSWDDLQLIIQAVNILRDNEVTKIELVLPYMLGARSDRNFMPYHQAHYMREVIAPIINSLGVSKVHVLDAHSDVVEATINKYKKSSMVRELTEIAARERKGRPFVVIAPDAGAEKRALYASSHLTKLYPEQFSGVIQCIKHRDVSTGHITSVEVLGNVNDLDCIIVDDLCDGGGTFIQAAEVLTAKGAHDVSLVVAHGIFSQGFDRFQGKISKVYTTDSFQSKDSMLSKFIRTVGNHDRIQKEFEKYVHVHSVFE